MMELATPSTAGLSSARLMYLTLAHTQSIGQSPAKIKSQLVQIISHVWTYPIMQEKNNTNSKKNQNAFMYPTYSEVN